MEQGNQEDRLGNLPDAILITILDRLNVREAARTGVLATRWRQLPAMLSQLRIYVWDFLPRGAPRIQVAETIRSNAAVVEATKSILGRRDSSRNTIHFLRMKFYLRDDDCISIGHAVGHAMATQKVEVAEFIVLTVRDDMNRDDPALLDYGRQFMSFFDACPGAFGGLTRLDLENLRFGESHVSIVLNTCKRLKYLSLYNCVSESCSKLQVEHSQLRKLAISNCSFVRVDLISLPKLTQLTFEGWIPFQDPVSFGYVPLLVVVGLTICGQMVKLSKFLENMSVRDLRLGFDCDKIWVQPEYLTKRLAHVFRQLRFVNLFELPEGYDLTWTFFILEAAPNLKELYMAVGECDCETDDEEMSSYSGEKGVNWESSACDFQHQNLATLAMFGFQFEDYMVSYVRRVVKAAVKLQDAFLYHQVTCSTCHENHRKPLRSPFTKEQQSLLTERITEGINSSAKIHFATGDVVRDDHHAKLMYP